jgi:hypothetical protein
MFERFDDPWSERPGTVLKGYDDAQICLNGHVINTYAASQPEHNSPRCKNCGAQTITECPKCKTKIRGHFHIPGVVSFLGPEPPPAFCFQCGEAYPWTAARLSAAREYVRELDRLDENEKGILSRSLDDLVRDTPNTSVAVLRFKKLAAKAGSVALEGLKSILVDVVVETAKRQIWS